MGYFGDVCGFCEVLSWFIVVCGVLVFGLLVIYNLFVLCVVFGV